MSGKRFSWNDRESIELSLTMVAVITGSIAATSGFTSASYEKQRIMIERQPAVMLACHPESRALDNAEGIKPPTVTALLGRKGAHFVHIVSDASGDTPEPFATCSLTNYGQLPVLNLRLRLTLLPGASAGVPTTLDVPGLAADSSFDFSLLNDTNATMRFAFERTISLIRVDSGERAFTPLYLDDGVAELQSRGARALPPYTDEHVNPSDALTVHITDFAYAPRTIHVREGAVVTFVNDDLEAHTVTTPKGEADSGTLAAGETWKHRFTHPGTYRYTCRFHPYMRGQLLISP